MTGLTLLLLAVAAVCLLFMLPFIIALLFEALPLIIAIAIELCIYGWLT